MRYQRNPPPPQLLTRAEAAAYLKVSQRTVSRYVRDGRLRANKINGRICILQEDVIALKREPPRSQARVDRRRLQLMSQRLMMLEVRYKEILDVMDEDLRHRIRRANEEM